MNECRKCFDVEPEDHHEIFWRCSCFDVDKKVKSLDNVVKRLDRLEGKERENNN